MFILRTLNVTNVKAMKISKDVRSTNTNVYDPIHNKAASYSNIVKLITKDNNSIRDTVINIIAGSINLKESEKELYICILDLDYHKEYVRVHDCTMYAHSVYDKSLTTYKRALDVLITKGVIRYNKDKSHVFINDEYDVAYIKGRDVSYVVIEVANVITSGGRVEIINGAKCWIDESGVVSVECVGGARVNKEVNDIDKSKG